MIWREQRTAIRMSLNFLSLGLSAPFKILKGGQTRFTHKTILALLSILLDSVYGIGVKLGYRVC